jgi:SNF2 family DNA or RNA helicase
MSTQVPVDTHGMSTDDVRTKIDDLKFQISTLDFATPNFSNVKSSLRREVSRLEDEVTRREALEGTGTRDGESINDFANLSTDTSAKEGDQMDSLPEGYSAPHKRRGNGWDDLNPWTKPSPSPLGPDQHLSRPFSSQPNLPSIIGFGAYAPSQQNGYGSPFASEGSAFTHRPSFGKSPFNIPPLRHTPETPTTPQRLPGSGSTSGSSPDERSIHSTPPLTSLGGFGSRKRQRESLTLPALKSMRTTPSPATTGVATPASEDSWDLGNDPDTLRLLGGNPNDDLRDIRDEQEATQQAIRDRNRQEELDRELAKTLSDGFDQDWDGFPSSQASNLTVAGPSRHINSPPAFSGYEAMTAMAARHLPPLSSIQPSHMKGSMNSPYTVHDSSSKSYRDPWESQYTPRPFKISPRSPQTKREPRIHLMDNFIDLGSDSETETVAPKQESDLVEIDPSSFRGSSRSNKAAATSSHHQNFGTVDSLVNKMPGAWNDSNDVPTFDLTGLDDIPGVSAFHTNQAPPPITYTQMVNQTANRALGMANSLFSYQSGPSTRPDISNGGMNWSATPGFDYKGFGDLLDTPAESVQDQLRELLEANPYDRHSTAYQQYRDSVSRLTSTSGSDALKTLLQNIRPDEELDAGPRTRMGTPEGMSASATLYEHQKLGLKWMIQMEDGSNKGGILADDMGLGKTIQAIALMVKRRSDNPLRKTTLIVAPVSLLRQWESEIALKVKPDKEHRLSTHIFHSARGKNTTWEILKQHDVVLTTYGTLAAEYNRKQVIDIQKRQNPSWRPTTAADHLPLLGEQSKWFRVILDEAQSVKNKATKSAKAVFELQALTRFCMSGTPMMNHVNELFSLVHFLRIKPYCEYERFAEDFSRPLKSSSTHAKETAMRKLQAFLKAVLLRRTKKSEIDGEPIITLPERITETQHAVFSHDEHDFYTGLEKQHQIKFNKYLRAGTVGRNYSNILVLLLRLRQACCHPHLIKDFGISVSGMGDVSIEDMIELAKNLSIDVVNRIKDAGAIECPICMDLAGNATIFTPCGHSTCSECFTKIQDPTQAMDDADGKDATSIKCPNCRGKVDPKKVIDFKSFKKVHMPDVYAAEHEDHDPEADIETESSDDDSDSDSDTSSLGGFIVKDDEADISTASEDDDDDLEKSVKAEGKATKEKKKKSKGKGKDKKPSLDKLNASDTPKSKPKGKGKAPETSSTNPKRKLTLAELKIESRKSVSARKKYLKRLSKDFVSSAKIDKVIEILTATSLRPEGEKTIIFSQFTSLLDLLEIPISRRHWSYRRYDGTMSATARNDAVLDFNSKPDCKIMLVSLKAGNSGLNLTSASQVIIFDPFWNPYIEEQAIDRAHRIGQRRRVEVHRVLVPNTVEDRIVALQEQKRAMIEGALDEGASQRVGRLGTRELAFLFVSD